MKLRLLKKHNELENVWSFYFEPEKPIVWQAGQSIRLELPKPTWGIEERRFSIASAPHEKHLQITTRISGSNFKQLLNNLIVGDMVDSYAIEGNFLWGKEKNPRLFLAGGIGITAFRPLLSQAIHDKITLNTTLIYSYNDKMALFKKDLDAWQSKDPTFYVRYLPKEHIEFDSHSTLSPFWRDSLIYISGPEKMVQELAVSLQHRGLSKGQLRLDHFTGNLTL